MAKKVRDAESRYNKKVRDGFEKELHKTVKEVSELIGQIMRDEKPPDRLNCQRLFELQSETLPELMNYNSYWLFDEPKKQRLNAGMLADTNSSLSFILTEYCNCCCKKWVRWEQ
jgi:hypothetical protein